MMYMMKQGDIAGARKIAALEARIEALEKAITLLQSEQRPKLGRPPKVKDEREDLRSLQDHSHS
jgi:hypothetical protein